MLGARTRERVDRQHRRSLFVRGPVGSLGRLAPEVELAGLPPERVAQRPRILRTAARLAARLAAPAGCVALTAVIFARFTGRGVMRLTGWVARRAFLSDLGANILNSIPMIFPFESSPRPARAVVPAYAGLRRASTGPAPVRLGSSGGFRTRLNSLWQSWCNRTGSLTTV